MSLPGTLPVCLEILFLETILESDANAVIKPKLATKWEVSSDLKTITLTLRQGVKFHDGSDWNATVAKWSIDLLITAKISDYVNVSSVDIVDNYTVRLNVTNYTNSILNTLASTRVVSKAAFDAHGHRLDELEPGRDGAFQVRQLRAQCLSQRHQVHRLLAEGQALSGWHRNVFHRRPDDQGAVFQAGEMDMIGGDLSKVEYDLQQKGFGVVKGYLGVSALYPIVKMPTLPFPISKYVRH